MSRQPAVLVLTAMATLCCWILCCVGLLWPVEPSTEPHADSSSAGPAAGAADTASEEALAGGAKRSRALVIVLHGGSWKPRTREQLARAALDELSREARRRKLRLLAPQAPAGCRSTVPWLEPAGEARVLALIGAEVAAGRAKEGRVGLAGHGAGATAALVLASRHPRAIAAVAAWSGTPPPLWNEQRQVVGLEPDPVPGLAGVPVYLWTGEDDPILDRGALAWFVKAMEGAAAADEDHELLWEHGAGGHDYGRAGPRRGLKFLAARLDGRRR